MPDALPGAELVERGVTDLRAGRRSVESALVARATSRLRDAGIDVPETSSSDLGAELYRLLDGDHGRYNALSRRLVSYLNARERASGR